MSLPYIKVFVDTSATIDLLSDAEAGRLLKSLLHYAVDGEGDELTGQEKLVFAMLRAQMDRDAASYQSYVDKQRTNGKKGGRPRNPEKPNETQPNPENPSLFSKTQKSQEKKEDKDKDKDEDKDRTKKKSVGVASPRFTPPSLSEVENYCLERKNGVDASRFVDFYASKGWKVGNQPMKDWKAAVRTWEKDRQKPQKETNPFGNVGKMV